jgi:methyl halide transferase
MNDQQRQQQQAEPQQRQKLQSIVSPDDPCSWDIAWKQNVTPWDHGNTQPPLKQILQELPITGSNTGSVPGSAPGRALVPGCGAGYDAIHIASVTGYHTIGLDISQTALDKANSLVPPELSSNISFKSGDFFSLKVDERFDLIYDYTYVHTFCCPVLRITSSTASL